MLTNLATRRSKLSLSTTALFALALISCAACKRPAPAVPVAVAVPVAEPVDPWKDAVSKVEQDRGEEVGRKANVEVPEQLRHYANRRRFLAVQEADLQPNLDAISGDFADLVAMIQKQELVEMKPIGADYILYGVGYSAGGEALTHYDKATKQDVPLAATEESFAEQAGQSSTAVKLSAANLQRLEAELRRARRDRSRRSVLLKEVAQGRKSLASTKATNKLLAALNADPVRRKAMLAEYKLLSNVARDFDGENYDLNDSDARRRFRIRLLSFIRPEARDVLTQIAHEYKEKFERPLPVSSLIRPVQYQRELAGTNANAARGPTPPHSTGLAFDLYYRYMSAAEQAYLMLVIAHLKDEGRVEALRESRDNIHVYVFGNRRRPNENVIARVISSEESRRHRKKARGSKGR